MIEYLHERCIEDGDCWIWQLACSGNGTPKLFTKLLGDKEKKQRAARRVMAQAMGLDIEGKLVTSKCGNPRCICPDHVMVVTKKHMSKLIAERTGFPQRLERRKKISDSARNRGKLKPEEVQAIRESSEPLRVVAERYGIAKGTAQGIRAHKTWKTYSSPFAGLL